MNIETAPQRLRTMPSWLLAQAAIESRRSVGQVLEAQAVHRSQYALLAAIEEYGPLIQADLSDRSGLDRSDVVRWVDELEGGGLVQRTRDPADRRRNAVSLTASGRRRLKQLDAVLSRAQADFLKALAPAEQRLLVELLSTVLGLPRDNA